MGFRFVTTLNLKVLSLSRMGWYPNTDLFSLPCLDELECKRYRRVHFVFELRVSLQPFLQRLFRPEEVCNPSAAAGKHDSRGRFNGCQFPFVEYDVNTVRAIRRGIVNDDFLISELAADQQHKVNRSVRIELAAAGQRDPM